jgi:hypothetical protein
VNEGDAQTLITLEAHMILRQFLHTDPVVAASYLFG